MCLYSDNTATPSISDQCDSGANGLFHLQYELYSRPGPKTKVAELGLQPMVVNTNPCPVIPATSDPHCLFIDVSLG